MRLTLVVDFYLLDVTDAFLMFRPSGSLCCSSQQLSYTNTS